jgi:DNA-binding HxlR family transcriptional regulator
MNELAGKIQMNKKGCACAISLELLGDKWTILIIRDLFRGKTTFTEFAYHTDEGIATNILSNRLKKLLQLGIISYQINPKDKKVKEYFLTEKGIDLYPLIYELQRWSIKHVEFEFTDNTKNWNRQLQTKSQKEIVSDYTSNYLNFRKNHFGF